MQGLSSQIPEHFYLPTLGSSAVMFALTTAFALTFAETQIMFFVFPMKAKYLIFSMLLIMSALAVSAQKGQDNKGGDGKTPGKGAAMYINRTGDLIVKAHKSVKTNKVYTGYLQKAQEKQVKAIELFKANNMKEAVKNSYVARRYAFMAYEANAGKVPDDWKMNENEVRVVHRMLPKPPQDADLKAEVSNTDKKTEEDHCAVLFFGVRIY